MKQGISTLGLKLEKRKQVKLQKQFDKQCAQHTFNIDPVNGLDRYVILDGSMYRVLLMEQGILVTDETGKSVEDRLLRLKILVQFNKQ